MNALHTSEIRPWREGFDPRDRTVRGICYDNFKQAGDAVSVGINGVVYTCLDGTLRAGEDMEYGNKVELHSGLWWRARGE